MRTIASNAQRAFLVVLCAVWLAACAGGGIFGPAFDESAFTNTVTLKSDTIILLNKSGEPYDSHKSEVEALAGRINLAYETARGRGDDPIVVQQWDAMRNPDGGLFGGFVKNWQKKGKVAKAVATDAIEHISKSYDQMICLLSNRRASVACPR